MRQFVLLATQRSGTNMLRSLLRTAPGLQVFPEIFHGRPSARSRMPEGLPRYFEFVAGEEVQGLGGGNPDASPELVLRYLDWLAQSAPPGISTQLLDIKYNSLHHAEGAWRTPSAPPKMLWMLKDRGSAVVHLVRDDVVALACSQLRASATGVFVMPAGERPPAQRIRCEPRQFLEQLRRIREDRRVVEDWIQTCGLEVCRVRFEDLFRDGAGSAIRPGALSGIAEFLGVDADGFSPQPKTAKVSPVRVRDGLDNFDEIKEFLEGTEFHDAISAHT